VKAAADDTTSTQRSTRTQVQMAVLLTLLLAGAAWLLIDKGILK